MSITNQEFTHIINALDIANNLIELQDLLQVVVEHQDKTTDVNSRRVVLLSELYLEKSTPLLKNLKQHLTQVQLLKG